MQGRQSLHAGIAASARALWSDYEWRLHGPVPCERPVSRPVHGLEAACAWPGNAFASLKIELNFEKTFPFLFFTVL